MLAPERGRLGSLGWVGDEGQQVPGLATRAGLPATESRAFYIAPCLSIVRLVFIGLSPRRGSCLVHSDQVGCPPYNLTLHTLSTWAKEPFHFN